MKFTLVLAIFAAFAAAGVTASETNAQRMARGLPPLPPAKRTPVEGAMRRQTSGQPYQQKRTPVEDAVRRQHSERASEAQR